MSDWDPLLEDLAVRRDAGEAMGGPEWLARQHEHSRLDARARVDALLDPGSFRELGVQAGSLGRGMTPATPADGLVAGHGTIAGRPVVVGAEDFTVMGGTIGVGTHAKRVRIATLAAQEQVPLVLLLEGAGERAEHVFERYPYAPSDLGAFAALSGVVPTVSVVMGVSAGLGAVVAPLTDFTVMVEGAALFAAGPPLVAAATGEEVSRSELGGAGVHAASGLVHAVARDDAAALAMVRDYLAFLPANAWTEPPVRDTTDGPRRLDALLDVVPADPRDGYDVHAVIALLADDGEVFEIQPAFGAAMVTAFVHLGGVPVAVVANNPTVAGGAIDAEAADKTVHFLDVASAFGLPVVFLADTPGLAIGATAERSATLRHAARLYAAQAGVRSPKLHVTLRRAYGLGAALMGMNPFDAQTTTLAFPGARIGPLPGESGAESATADPDVAQLLEHAELGGAYSAADRLTYDDVIDPRDLRNELLAALALSAPRRARGPAGPGGAVRP